MQPRNRTPVLIALLAVAAVAVSLYLYYDAKNPRYVWRDSWSKHAYNPDSDQPYGTQVIHRLLGHYFPGKGIVDIKRSLANELPSADTTDAVYVFVGEAMFLDSAAAASLLAFVNAGHTAFIAGKSVPDELMEQLYQNYYNSFREWNEFGSFNDEKVRMTLLEPQGTAPVSVHFADRNRPTGYYWQYLMAEVFEGGHEITPIGYLGDSLSNFASFPCGDGFFLIHTNPLVFTNYSLLQPKVQAYAEAVFSWLPEGVIYWDNASRIPEATKNYAGGGDTRHPLVYILQQPALAWAWYLLVALTLAWLVFRAKRRQRAIPVLPVNENSSYEFIDTIANLHFREKNYQGLCIQNMKQFLAQVRERYGLISALEPGTHFLRAGENFLRRLATVSEVPESKIDDIFKQYTATVRYQPTEEMMVDLHLALEDFWKKAK
ncbi:MAG: hypothetical protein KDC70_16600 [Saprospiraceae bacterium]|nr:hypothetical protein [Saprospiraceae bacterium]